MTNKHTIMTVKHFLGVIYGKTNKFLGFTLAETLITIGIIGIVASMTLPNLVQRYRKQRVEVSLAKFYSTINQAVQHSIAEYGEIPLENENLTTSANSEYITQWYRTYLTKYFKKIKEESNNSAYYRVIFLDGSGFNSYLSSGGSLYIFYCIDYSKCNYGAFDGINNFLFIYRKKSRMVVPEFDTLNHQDKLNSCSKQTGGRHACAALIQENGWKIPDDYPWKF